MSFLDKLKSGVSEAGTKAKILVEINRLKLINVGKQNEISGLYKEIGEKVALAAEAGQELQLSFFSHQLEQISILKTEIEQNQLKMLNLADDKQCPSCNRSNPIDAIGCVHCNASFIVQEHSTIEPQYIELNHPTKQARRDDE
ncbi:zinc ribbon domain-containing protein [Paenibacillus camelliae]|uniref:zinc ribbon domain-containing protein n=1 Tax=Paenibacillus camelliae TaxID=512410 RepID=UPI00203E1E0A|nr:zinc ribbon domain-containing protein [Paenibacillus camelliae]MCM3632353.1 zinc ribbon domain-containing protein [Paenibacillus camelliae]